MASLRFNRGNESMVSVEIALDSGTHGAMFRTECDVDHNTKIIGAAVGKMLAEAVEAIGVKTADSGAFVESVVAAFVANVN